MKSFYERSAVDWRTHDWSSLQGTRLYAAICEGRPNLERLLHKGPEEFEEQEWAETLPVLETLDEVMRCNEILPYDSMHLEDSCADFAEAKRRWLAEAVALGHVGCTEGESLMLSESRPIR